MQFFSMSECNHGVTWKWNTTWFASGFWFSKSGLCLIRTSLQMKCVWDDGKWKVIRSSLWETRNEKIMWVLLSSPNDSAYISLWYLFDSPKASMCHWLEAWFWKYELWFWLLFSFDFIYTILQTFSNGWVKGPRGFIWFYAFILWMRRADKLTGLVKMPELVSVKAGVKAQALLNPALLTAWLLILGNWTGLVINAKTLKIHVSVCLWDFLKFLVFNSTAVTTRNSY